MWNNNALRRCHSILVTGREHLDGTSSCAVRSNVNSKGGIPFNPWNPLSPWKIVNHDDSRMDSGVRSFHSTTTRRDEDSAKDALVDILEREHEEEKMNNSTDMPPVLVELKDKIAKDWKIVEDDNMATIRMVRNDSTLNLKVQIGFHCQDTVENEGEEEAAQEEGEEEDYEELSMPIRFTVTASKAGETLVFSCLSAEAMAQIQSVAVTSSDDDTQLLQTGAVPAADYQGPEFFELAEDLQGTFQEFLEKDLGINDDVASFVAMYTDFKEQQQYVKFLERAKRVLS